MPPKAQHDLITLGACRFKSQYAVSFQRALQYLTAWPPENSLSKFFNQNKVTEHGKQMCIFNLEPGVKHAQSYFSGPF